MISLKHSVVGLALNLGAAAVHAADQPVDWKKLLSRSAPAVQAEWAAKYEHGEGVPQDYTRAVQLYCAAAGHGDVAAQYQLGWLYANGRGVDRDDALAAAWFRRAAANGSAQARNMLGLLDDPRKVQKARCVLPSVSGSDLELGAASGARRRQVEEWVYRLAPGYGLDPRLVLAVIGAESAFDPRARSLKNAQGLMQLIPETADRFGVRDILDPVQNLRGGMAYLRWLLAFFLGDVRLALAGYNAGEAAVEQYQGIPPYPETRAYVAKIIRLYGRTYHPPVAQVVEPSAMSVALSLR